MNDNRVFFGIIGLLIIAVIGLAVDRSNQITSLTEQANAAATAAQEASDEMVATVDAQASELEAQVQAVADGAEQNATLEANFTMMSVSATELQEQLVDSDEANTALENLNTDLSAQVSDVSGERDDLATQVADQMDVADGMATEIADVSSQRDDLSEQIDGLSTQVAEVSDERDAAIEGSDARATEVADLTGELEAIATQIAESVPPTPEPTIEAETSAAMSGDLDVSFSIDVAADDVGISPDGASIAVLSGGNTIQLFSSEDGTSQLELPEFDTALDSFIYADSGRSMAAVVDGDGIAVFDSATGSISYEDTFDNPIISYDFAPEGAALIIGTRQNIEIVVFETDQKQTRQDGISSLDWSADGSAVVTANGRSVSVLEIDDNTISDTTVLETDGARIVDVTFSPDGTSIAGVTVDNELVMLSVESGSTVFSAALELDAVDDVAWSGDSQHVAIFGDGMLRIYGIDGTFAFETEMAGVTAVEWSADGSFLVFASESAVSVVSADTLMN